jgi:hypothetical protein
MPVSQTSIRKLLPERRHPIRIRPPGSVYLIALLTRLRKMAFNRTGLLMTRAAVEQTCISMPFRRALSSFSRHSRHNSGAIATGAISIVLVCS